MMIASSVNKWYRKEKAVEYVEDCLSNAIRVTVEQMRECQQLVRDGKSEEALSLLSRVEERMQGVQEEVDSTFLDMVKKL